jgi:hypothetical protein
MPRKTLILLSIFIVTTLAALTIYFNSRLSFDEKPETRIAIENWEEINQITISQRGVVIKLDKNMNGLWYLNQTQLAENRLVEYLLGIIKNIIIKDEVTEELLAPVQKTFSEEGLVVEYKIGQKIVRSVTIAFSGLNPDEFFIKNNEYDVPLVAVNPSKSILFDLVSDFGPHSFDCYTIISTDVSDIEKVEVKFNENPKNSFIIKTKPNLNIEGIRKIDTLRANSYLKLFEKVEVRRWINQRKNDIIDSLQKLNPTFEVEILDKNKSTNLKIFYKAGQKSPVMTLVDTNKPAILNTSLFEYILQKREFFEKK